MNVKMGATRITADGTADDEIDELARQKLAGVVAVVEARRAS